MKYRVFAIIVIFVFVFSSCTSKPGEQAMEPQQSPTQTATLAPSVTPTHTVPPTITPTPTPTFTPTPDIPVDINNYFPFPLSTITVNNLPDLKLLGKIGGGELLSVEISSDQLKIIAIYNTQILILDSKTLDIKDQLEVEIPIDGRIEYQISPDSSYLAILLNSSLMMYDLIALKPIESFNVKFESDSRSRFSQFQFSEDGKFFKCRLDKDVKWGIWNTADQEFMFTEEGVKPQFLSNNLIVIGYGKTLIIRDLEKLMDSPHAEDVMRIIVEGNIISYIVTNDGHYLSVSSLIENGTKYVENSIWNLQTQEVIINNQCDYPLTMKFSPSGQYAYAPQRRGDTKYNFWRVEDGQLMNVLNYISGYSPVFNKDESKMAVVEYRNGIQSVLIYETERFFQIARIPFGDRTFGNFLVTEDKNFIITYSMSAQQVKIIDFESSQRVCTIDSITNYDIQLFDNQYLIAPTQFTTAIFEIPSGDRLIDIPFHVETSFPMDETVFVSDKNGEFSIWSIQQVEEIISSQPVHSSRYYTNPEKQGSLLEWENILTDETLDTFFELSHKSDAYTELPERNYSREAQIFVRYKSGIIEVFKKMSAYSLKGLDNASLAFEIEAKEIKDNLLRLSPDGRVIIGVKQSGVLDFWSTETGELIATTRLTHGIKDLIVSPDSQRIYVSQFSGGYDERFSVLELPSGRLLFSRVITGKKYRSDGWDSCLNMQISLSGDGKKFVAISENCSLGVYDTEYLTEIQSIELDPSHYLQTAISQTGDILAVSQQHSLIDFYDVSTGEKIFSLQVNDPEFYDKPTVRFDFTFDGKLFAVSRGASGGEILLFGIWQ